ncbi:unnamed protein product [Amoebophrya sp. A25]|nr:unnamed protein product [Amoebophrya sp. A25]|eukprot:GSA25T00019122001.1
MSRKMSAYLRRLEAATTPSRASVALIATANAQDYRGPLCTAGVLDQRVHFGAPSLRDRVQVLERALRDINEGDSRTTCSRTTISELIFSRAALCDLLGEATTSASANKSGIAILEYADNATTLELEDEDSGLYVLEAEADYNVDLDDHSGADEATRAQIPRQDYVDREVAATTIVKKSEQIDKNGKNNEICPEDKVTPTVDQQPDLSCLIDLKGEILCSSENCAALAEELAAKSDGQPVADLLDLAKITLDCVDLEPTMAELTAAIAETLETLVEKEEQLHQQGEKLKPSPSPNTRTQSQEAEDEENTLHATAENNTLRTSTTRAVSPTTRLKIIAALRKDLRVRRKLAEIRGSLVPRAFKEMQMRALGGLASTRQGPGATSQQTFRLEVSEKLRWDHVGHLEEVKKTLLDTLMLPTVFAPLLRSSPVRPRLGVALVGPTGSGKTFVVHALCARMVGHVRFFQVKAAELLSKYIGESEANVRRVFEKANECQPSCIFFDEIEALCPVRGQNSTGVTDRVVNQMLTYLDGIVSRKQLFVIAASTNPEMVDPALLRPGRLDKILYCRLPETCSEYASIARAVLDGGGWVLEKDADEYVFEQVGEVVTKDKKAISDVATTASASANGTKNINGNGKIRDDTSTSKVLAEDTSSTSTFLETVLLRRLTAADMRALFANAHLDHVQYVENIRKEAAKESGDIKTKRKATKTDKNQTSTTDDKVVKIPRMAVERALVGQYSAVRTEQLAELHTKYGRYDTRKTASKDDKSARAKKIATRVALQ